MVPRKTWVSENFGPISKTLEVFLMGLEVSFLSDFCVLESRTFLPTDLRVSDLLVFGVQESKFGRVHGSELQ